ncbi:OsmC family protein [Gracilimonas mengyeensis]|uniref:Peroxiredoxin, SACOL1771 subfamily n=1 Tax=Gracilimonas mengyeensis TaxID=1302730 RepID=A0A521C5N9_9BACT|nr:OsmC family protein [Gracilimonas mengyeensis]SMO54675.1 peroxiredoxin, SACOL1771 subfamily [Gracilimonas mengyeensis]
MSDQEHNYQVDLDWTRGRKGTLSSDKLETEIEVATPPEFPGGVEGIWSPEHLFVASVSSCFMTTFTAIAEYSKLKFENLSVKAIGTMAKVDGKFAMTEIVLKPTLIIQDEKYVDKAHRIMEKAESACLISRSVKTTISLDGKVVVGAMN